MDKELIEMSGVTIPGELKCPSSEGELYYSNGTSTISKVIDTSEFLWASEPTTTLSVSFDGTGKISGISEIEFSNGTKFTLPKEGGKENQILIYTKDKKFVWKNETDLWVVNSIHRNIQEIQQLRKEIQMYKGLQFTDYFTMFVIALFAIWVVKKISWRIVLTPIKKLFKFAEKKAGEVEVELKKAEETWKEID